MAISDRIVIELGSKPSAFYQNLPTLELLAEIYYLVADVEGLNVERVVHDNVRFGEVEAITVDELKEAEEAERKAAKKAAKKKKK